ncbi:hypothetical protein DYY66_1355 [Candidatus Nitrosotalea sp. FS]|nr:hypothetical protein [Candidatus Nitrosotalea sp. FS]
MIQLKIGNILKCVESSIFYSSQVISIYFGNADMILLLK